MAIHTIIDRDNGTIFVYLSRYHKLLANVNVIQRLTSFRVFLKGKSVLLLDRRNFSNAPTVIQETKTWGRLSSAE